MKNKKSTTQECGNWENWAQATYSTGSTRPPKSHGGIIAVLLVLVIFLCGISTALGLMNIRLLDQLSAMEVTEAAPVAFSQGDESAVHAAAQEYALGFAGQEVPAFWQTYRDLPAGIYVVDITGDSLARSQGLQPGDILVQVDGVALSAAQDLEDVLRRHSPGDPVEAVLYRGGQELTLTLIMEGD